MKETAATLISLAILFYIGIPIHYWANMNEGKYAIYTDPSMWAIPYETDSITEDTIRNKIIFTDINVNKTYTISGSYVISTKK